MSSRQTVTPSSHSSSRTERAKQHQRHAGGRARAWRWLPRIRAAALAAVVLIALSAQVRGQGSGTALDRYVAEHDEAYSFHLARRLPGEGNTAYLLEMTSQSWGRPSEIDRSDWKHWLTIYQPKRVEHATALLFIAAGNNEAGAPEQADSRLSNIAQATHSVVAELRMVPNQPLTFAGDSYGPRVEDEILAGGWKRYLDTGETRWLFHLPMTKSAVRAMDTVTAFMAGPEGGGIEVNRFVVAGGSKRGWTTWLAAAVDERVAGIVPLVIDLPNIKPSFSHHYRAYGFWAPAIKDYYRAGIMDRIDEPRFDQLLGILDPFSYRQRYTMPKFLINSAGDQFFLPDSARFYFDELSGEKYLRYVPNSDHSLSKTDAIDSLIAFYRSLLTGERRPRFSWKFEPGGTVRVTTADRPTEVNLWHATNRRYRDFRLESLGPVYQSKKLAPQPDASGNEPSDRSAAETVYAGRVETPEEGWTAFFVELTYPSGLEKYPFKFTTPVRVVPQTYPYPEPEPGRTRIGPQKQ